MARFATLRRPLLVSALADATTHGRAKQAISILVAKRS
jgi:hypothetical protein